ncbi:MAG TPA: MFS transporter [Vicinamibacterales bacterium]|nr:MFS transporter [Vicinamibacterales bacterium]
MSHPVEPVSTATAPWYRTTTPTQRRTLLAAALGWMLDSMDVMLYSMVLAYLMADLGMSKETAGLLGSITLLASAAGGVAFGILADRWGRARSLTASIVIYSVFTAACGFSRTVTELAVFRVLLGLGMGGEWASGAALVAETWPAAHRGKALGLVQSAWAVGYALAAVIAAVVLPRWGWRAVFFVGVFPAIVTIWIQRSVEEPEIWKQSRRRETSTVSGLRMAFSGPLGRAAVALTLMNAGTMFAWWGFNLWIPAYLSLPVAEGGIGLTAVQMSFFVIVMQVGMWLGYVTYGFISDVIGRKKTYVIYLVLAAGLLPLYAVVHTRLLLLLLGPVVAFFGTGYFSGFGVVTAELFPTSIRATAQGLTYNVGRIASAVAPFTVGSLADRHGFGVAFAVIAAAFVFAAAMWAFIPETRGQELYA